MYMGVIPIMKSKFYANVGAPHVYGGDPRDGITMYVAG